MMETKGDLLERLDELPSLPAVYHRVRQTLENPDGSLETVAAIIEADPALAARLLRVANSALYGLATKVDTVLRALTIIGAAETHNLVLATTLVSVFRDLPLGAVSMRSFWEHSIACGVAARVIARVGGRASPDRAYLAGLLHDIGRLPLYILEPHIMGAALQAHRDRQGHLFDLEQQFFGSSHAEIGAALLRGWAIPEVFCAAAAHHHRPALAEHPAPEIAVTHVADLVANSLRIGTSGARWTPILDDLAWRATGLETAQLRAVVETTIATTRDVTSAFLEH
ncbi:HDOD domain-containing protein [Thiorhodococcus minor]|nr:HDOD domain-containing protein [Thiorhodococcus minor]